MTPCDVDDMYQWHISAYLADELRAEVRPTPTLAFHLHPTLAFHLHPTLHGPPASNLVFTLHAQLHLHPRSSPPSRVGVGVSARVSGIVRLSV